jgi:hypothetical protein
MGNISSQAYRLDIKDRPDASKRRKVLSDKDFVMLYPSNAQDASLAQAILALYYLPPQFKLKVLADATVAQDLLFNDHEAVRSRIIIESGADAGFSTLSRIDAIVHNENMPVRSESKMPRVVISDSTDNSLISDEGKFTISANSPEALATAVLRIARAVN